jgi:hypothetical protein
VALVALLFSTHGCCFGVCDYFLNVDGIVLGSQNRPVAGAQIEAKPFHDPQDTLYNSYFEARSRSDGCFRFDGFSVPPQQWVPLTVVAPGYKSVAEQIPGTASNHLIVTLVPQGSEAGDSKALLVPAGAGSTPFPQCKLPYEKPADSR